MDHDLSALNAMEDSKMAGAPIVNGNRVKAETSTPPTDTKNRSRPVSRSSVEDKPRINSVSPPEASLAPRLSRKSSQKSVKREVPLFDHLPDSTEESCQSFQVIPDCLYGSKNMGSTDNDALDCDCREDFQHGANQSCGEDSDCINRATKMECVIGAGNCGEGCQNQRFQRKLFANVSVIKTEKKGYGLRANIDMQANDFIFEYIGEVINEPTFRRRMVQYDEENIKHFYFMSLTKYEFVDATKKGNLGRFCNHSCNPNCYVDKWVVGDKLRMGIFTARTIKAGEELVFNYNVDRYGADPQPCYCGEPNCTGYIGGKTQTERATKLPLATVEALGIDDGDSWETAVAKKPRKKKPDEDDEEYVNSVPARGLNEEGARKVMATLMQCKEKWIAVKLLERIQRCDDPDVINCVMRMHAYQILKTTLNTFIDDNNVVHQVLNILDKFPRLTRNKIQDSKIEATIEGLTQSEQPAVAAESKRLLEEWSKLEVAFRIKRRKVDPNAPNAPSAINSFEERRNMDREVERPKPEPALGPEVPKGPRSNVPQRNANFFAGNRHRRPQGNFNGPLPEGWFTAKDARGNVYFYSKNGVTTWQRPTKPASEPGKAAAKVLQEQQLLQSIIDSVTKEQTPKSSDARTPQQAETPAKENKQEKWRSLPVEKQMKIYENTLFPHVKHVLDKYKHKLPKEDLKKFGRDVNKKLVASDYKNNRVEDPTAALSSKQSKKVKQYVKDFLDRAVVKFGHHDQSKDGEKTSKGEDVKSADPLGQALDAGNVDEDTPMADAVVEGPAVSDTETASTGSQDRKRKREGEGRASISATPSEPPSNKRLKEDDETHEATPPPPPPPPPPPEAAPEDPVADTLTSEQKALREQEEALMRENEEAERLEAAERQHDGKNAIQPILENQQVVVNGLPKQGGLIISGEGEPTINK